jgi:hypothetical protein
MSVHERSSAAAINNESDPVAHIVPALAPEISERCLDLERHEGPEGAEDPDFYFEVDDITLRAATMSIWPELDIVGASQAIRKGEITHNHKVSPRLSNVFVFKGYGDLEVVACAGRKKSMQAERNPTIHPLLAWGITIATTSSHCCVPQTFRLCHNGFYSSFV